MAREAAHRLGHARHRGAAAQPRETVPGAVLLGAPGAVLGGESGIRDRRGGTARQQLLAHAGPAAAPAAPRHQRGPERVPAALQPGLADPDAVRAARLGGSTIGAHRGGPHGRLRRDRLCDRPAQVPGRQAPGPARHPLRVRHRAAGGLLPRGGGSAQPPAHQLRRHRRAGDRAGLHGVRARGLPAGHGAARGHARPRAAARSRRPPQRTAESRARPHDHDRAREPAHQFHPHHHRRAAPAPRLPRGPGARGAAGAERSGDPIPDDLHARVRSIVGSRPRIRPSASTSPPASAL